MQEMPSPDGLQPASLGFRLGGVDTAQITGLHPATPGAKFQMYSVREAFEAALRRTAPAAQIKRLRMPPVFGGLLYHFVHNGLPVTAERVEYISKQAQQTAVATA
jgi:hypothetical protein